MELTSAAAASERRVGEGRSRRRFGIASVVLGAVGALPPLGVVVGPVAIALGLVSGTRRGGRRPSRILGAAGVALGAAAVLTSAIAIATPSDDSPAGGAASAPAPLAEPQAQPQVPRKKARLRASAEPPDRIARAAPRSAIVDEAESEEQLAAPARPTTRVAPRAQDRGWADRELFLSLLSPVFGLAGAGAGAWLSRRDRRHGDRTHRRREAVAAVVPVQTLLADADPRRLLLSGDAFETLQQLQRRWIEHVRDPLLVYAATHPAEKLGDEARTVAELVSDSLACTAAVVRESPLIAADLEQAVATHARAREHADRLLRTVRRRSATLV